jgi:prepilin-type N-terminal cleavage/methylation domain-containing protein
MTKQAGFTLIEVIAVVVILGMLVGIASMNLRGHVNRAKMVQAVTMLEDADRYARAFARKEHIPLEMTLSRKTRTISIRSSDSSASKKPVRSWKLPSGISMNRIRDSQGLVEANEKEISISANGTSPMYAIGLAGANRNASWLVTLGFSGQHIRLEKEADVVVMFSQ